MPEFYPSIGEAVGAAMQHNIRLAYGGKAHGSDTPLQVRHKPPAAQNPEADRRRAARASSPHAGTQRIAPSVGATSEPPASAPPPRSPRSR